MKLPCVRAELVSVSGLLHWRPGGSLDDALGGSRRRWRAAENRIQTVCYATIVCGEDNGPLAMAQCLTPLDFTMAWASARPHLVPKVGDL